MVSPDQSNTLIFKRRVQGVHSPKSDIDALILEYLTMEGYPEAAAKFSKEANLEQRFDSDTMEMRQTIHKYILGGMIQEATEALNEYDPEILDTDAELHFYLLRLQLVELIRVHFANPQIDASTALMFAQNHLGERALQHPEFLDALEKTVAILIFGPDNLAPPLAAILHPNMRWEVAENVNKAILHRQSTRREAAIRQLIRMRAWAESEAREHKEISKFLPATLEFYPNSEVNAGNGHEPMVMS